MIRNSSFDYGIVDLTNPTAVAWFKAVLRDQVLGSGADGWMADFGEELPYDAHLFNGAPASTLHNWYPEAWARLNRVVVDESGRAKDLVFFMRSGYTKSPGLADLFWAGDQLVTWDAYDGIKTAVIAPVEQRHVRL